MASEPLPRGETKRAVVQDMFDRIAPRYDLMNRLLSLGLDQRWRRRALDLAAVGPADVLLDLACGTGDLSELARDRGATVLGVDFAGVMLGKARSRQIDASFLQADGAALPLADGSVTVITSGFALRNFVALPQVFAELARVMAPGGRLALLDVDRPSSAIVRFGHSLWFDRVVPFVGGLLSDKDAYSYLPASTVYLPEEQQLLELLSQAGFDNVAKQGLLFGAAQILTGVRRAG
ncbi:MAG: demethylmenaquinone methyltransferase/2-methoxy-6-polyprenyl-1,4-benzoquinol methylase [Pseudohongiellaceae bacterium]|jgi:demethylmenaquinone methyltransferase/2-methoxy-6-polyprenyl-1,4-benzoquinol methylase